ncbi:putative solute carrier family 35 member SLC35F1/F2/F6 [Helianthus annuus]|nr:putative solute carrier family 35 member SLC35F1/F2/F6 [Helianthus annuus]
MFIHIKSHHQERISWYWYVLLAFVAVQGSYLANKAFQFSSITSVTILNCWTIVWVIMLTWLFLGTKYSLWQFLGAAICVSGLCLVLLSDSGVGGDGGNNRTPSIMIGGSNPVLGDALMIAGTCFFAFSNVGEVGLTRTKKSILTQTHFDPTINLSIMQLHHLWIIFELKNLESISWSPQVTENRSRFTIFYSCFISQVLSFIGFGISGFMFFSLTPLVLQASGATLFNLSLLTANMWAVAIRVFIYHQTVIFPSAHVDSYQVINMIL